MSIGDFSMRSDPEDERLELQALTKQQIARFGRGLPKAELEWIREVVTKAIAA